LLPAETLKRAFEHRDPYNPHPVWLNFLGLFRAIDEGNAGLNIPPYNGGLFAPGPALDALRVPTKRGRQVSTLHADMEHPPLSAEEPILWLAVTWATVIVYETPLHPAASWTPPKPARAS
jgi:hypothetical protein